MAACWSCANPPGNGPFCGSCGKIQPAGAQDPFAVLGVPRRLHQDEALLETRWREISRKVHPDKFSRATPKERRFSLEQATRLNEAFRALRDRMRRAEALLKLEGFEVASDAKPVAVKLPPGFLEQAMEDREALADARMQGEDAVQALAAKVRERRDATIEEIDRAFGSWEGGGGQEALAPAVEALAKTRYFARFLDEVGGHEDA